MPSKHKKLVVSDIYKCIGCYCCMLACARFRFDALSTTYSAIQVKTQGGLESGFVVVACHMCKDPACARACKTGALTKRPGGGSKLNPERCNGCGLCIKACMIGALRADEEGRPIVCDHCGTCAEFCPHGVLKLEEVRA
jgi:Fe-S-cluster-containing dehydrogenase component